jgi:hypothetical protein
MWLRAWFKRVTGKWFGRRLAASIAPRRKARKQPAVRPDLVVLEDRYAPAMLAALRQMKDLYRDIKVTDASLRELAMLNELQSLGLSGIITEGTGLEGLDALGNLEKPQLAQDTWPSYRVAETGPGGQPEGHARLNAAERTQGPRTVETWLPPSRRLLRAASL